VVCAFVDSLCGEGASVPLAASQQPGEGHRSSGGSGDWAEPVLRQAEYRANAHAVQSDALTLQRPQRSLHKHTQAEMRVPSLSNAVSAQPAVVLLSMARL